MNVEVREVDRAGRRAAIELLLAPIDAEDRAAQVDGLLAALDEGTGDDLLGAYRQDRLMGVVLSQLQPGRTAGVWLPQAVGDAPVDARDRLLAAACGALDARGVCLAQMLLAECPAEDESLLGRNGFVHLADLLYLVCLEDALPDVRPAAALSFEALSPSNETRLMQIVESTYHETRDCPSLNGVRAIEDVMAGYRASGVFEPSRWLVVRRGGQDVGCLLLADYPRQEQFELVYMGVMPAFRGEGHGLEIARYAQWLTRRAGRKRLVLAVDADNAPAKLAYAAAGFRAWDRRLVFLRMGR
jgi:ribosomal protein S18 acetylase RimI-like enzyme